jgi:hypothetical protein
MGWPEAFCTVGCAFAIALGVVGFIYCMCKYGQY